MCQLMEIAFEDSWPQPLTRAGIVMFSSRQIFAFDRTEKRGLRALAAKFFRRHR
jgi:hypothetical protein